MFGADIISHNDSVCRNSDIVLLDFSDKRENFDVNMFCEGGLTEKLTQMFCSNNEFCQSSLDRDIYYDWQKDINGLGVQQTKAFELNPTKLDTSHVQISSPRKHSPSRCSQSFCQNVSDDSSACDAKSSRSEGCNLLPSAPLGNLSNAFTNFQNFPSRSQKYISNHSSNAPPSTELQDTLRSEDMRELPLSHTIVANGQQIQSLSSAGVPQKYEDDKESKISMYVGACLTDYSFCVIDNFMGPKNGQLVLAEVVDIEKNGLFEDGRLVSQERNYRTVRGDKIYWIESDLNPAISQLIRRMDRIIFGLRGSFSGKSITRRTKPMVACYPGSGAAYMRHVDNSNQDGRLITCLYYLNKDWDSERYGGILRLYPHNGVRKIDIDPKFDRLLMFWSDCRNPHEVLPSFKNRYAITVWYFDDEERERARRRHQ